MLKEFKEFAMKGNVLDMAVGVIIGAAFSKIVASLVDDIIMPLIGAVFGGLDFSNYFLRLSSSVPANVASYADAKKAGAVLGYGAFLTAVVNFLIVAFVLFLVIRQMNRLIKKKDEAPAAPPPPPEEVVLLREIRDSLARR
ncbi:MAG: large conductance mechanosensitive channel protein MscL [Hyphomicrobiales bacterium]|nr:large conductance mechanosensitive channel protein MscL [Hyphomicrobiales bacterium]